MKKLLAISIVLGLSSFYIYAESPSTPTMKSSTSSVDKNTTKKSHKMEKMKDAKSKMSKCGSAHNRSKSGKC